MRLVNCLLLLLLLLGNVVLLMHRKYIRGSGRHLHLRLLNNRLRCGPQLLLLRWKLLTVELGLLLLLILDDRLVCNDDILIMLLLLLMDHDRCRMAGGGRCVVDGNWGLTENELRLRMVLLGHVNLLLHRLLLLLLLKVVCLDGGVVVGWKIKNLGL